MELDDKRAGQIRLSRSDVIAKKNKWAPIKTEETKFPLMLAWTCTVRKVQRFSLTFADVSFHLEKQSSFNEGQMYVALSRVSSVHNLFLVRRYKCNAFKLNEYAVLNIAENKKTGLILIIKIALIIIVLQYHY